ncbi:MAG: sugar phosphate isomerase/epimerase [Ruminococcaceae bacterium]|nr:sugar phosphate isomerase/epimerase [Oscillospiraceae bacterium]
MKIGWCCDLKDILTVQSLGFDYIEGAAASVAQMDEAEFSAVLSLVKSADIIPEAFCILFKAGISLVGDEVCLDTVDNYIAPLFERLAKLGGTTVVFGSGRARRVPDGFSRDRAWEQLVSVGSLLGKRAAENGLTVALEPLNPAECNILNDGEKGAELVNTVSHPNFKLLLDYYHMGKAGEDIAHAETYAPLLAHTHIAHPVTRANPTPDDNGDYELFFASLKKGGYHRRVSFEGRINDPAAELPETLAYLRRLANNT